MLSYKKWEYLEILLERINKILSLYAAGKKEIFPWKNLPFTEKVGFLNRLYNCSFTP